MTGFRAALAEEADWRRAVASVVAQLGDAPASVGFLYVTGGLARDLADIVSALRLETGVPAWTGTAGAGVCATGREVFDAPALAVLVADLPTDRFRLFGPVTDVAAAEAALPPGIGDTNALLGVVHGDPRTGQLPGIVSEVSRVTGAFLVGGLTSAEAASLQVASASDGGGIGEGGVSGLLVSAHQPVVTGLTQGCQPLASPHVVTAGSGTIVATLDDRPALGVVLEDLGIDRPEELATHADSLFVGLPVSGSDTGDYLVRNLVGIDPEDGRIAVNADLAVGDRLMLCRRDRASAVADMQRMLDDIAARAGAPPKGALYFSCLARGPHQFGPGAVEASMIRDVLGPIPMAGFFGNGEVSHDRLYGYTGVLTLFL